MRNACRHNLHDLAERGTCANPGLALQRYLLGRPTTEEQRKGVDPTRDLLERVQASPASEVYKAAFRRHKEALPDPVQMELTLGGPLALGLGMSSPLEVGLTTLHTYGMPVIPGSAIKGVCRDYAEALMKEGRVTQDQFHALIGDQKNAGLCVFYDAWYVPGSAPGDKPFHRDVVTVHHPEYYQNKGAVPPTDFDDPTPVPFIVVKPGAKFLFAVKPPSPEWADFVRNLLIHALTKHGVGGKVNAGYGWFKDPDGGGDDPRKQEPPNEEAALWSACSVSKRPDRRGGFSIVLKSQSGRLELTQGDWSRMTGKWPNDKRRSAEQGQITVCASVRQQGDHTVAVAIEPEG